MASGKVRDKPWRPPVTQLTNKDGSGPIRGALETYQKPDPYEYEDFHFQTQEGDDPKYRESQIEKYTGKTIKELRDEARLRGKSALAGFDHMLASPGGLTEADMDKHVWHRTKMGSSISGRMTRNKQPDGSFSPSVSLYNSPNPGLTSQHEGGHAGDYKSIPKRPGYTALDTVKTILLPWMDTSQTAHKEQIAATEKYTELQARYADYQESGEDGFEHDENNNLGEISKEMIDTGTYDPDNYTDETIAAFKKFEDWQRYVNDRTPENIRDKRSGRDIELAEEKKKSDAKAREVFVKGSNIEAERGVAAADKARAEWIAADKAKDKKKRKGALTYVE
jgi:hypothetical protein